VSALVSVSTGSVVSRIWRDTPAWIRLADVVAIGLALVLPWSTSLVAILATAWLVVLVPTLDIASLQTSMKHPASALALALFGLAFVGTLWSDAPWAARIYAVGPTVKFLLLPPLIWHFGRTHRAIWVFVAFLVSCALLMLLSFAVALDPHLALKQEAEFGVPVKNYIDQSQEFGLCAVALTYPVIALLRERRFALASTLAAVGLGFMVNMGFVVVSRTELITIPVLLLVFAMLHLDWRGRIATLVAILVLSGAAWLASPRLQATTGSVFWQYDLYQQSSEPTSIGLRMEFWRKSLGFFTEAPLLGHGTGAIRGLFENAAVGRSGAAAAVVGNPHNQTLNVAIQWGSLGIVLLYAMWLVHLSLFRGEGLASWIGLMVVAQNIVSSLFNSHLFDFHEGWMYVLGVGVAAGITLRERGKGATAAAPRSIPP
jgi:O-antigen ligase